MPASRHTPARPPFAGTASLPPTPHVDGGLQLRPTHRSRQTLRVPTPPTPRLRKRFQNVAPETNKYHFMTTLVVVLVICFFFLHLASPRLPPARNDHLLMGSKRSERTHACHCLSPFTARGNARPPWHARCATDGAATTLLRMLSQTNGACVLLALSLSVLDHFLSTSVFFFSFSVIAPVCSTVFFFFGWDIKVGEYQTENARSRFALH